MATIHGSNFSDNNTRQGIPFFETLIPEIDRRRSTSSDEIYGLAGNDIIRAGSGSDVIYGDRSSSQQRSVGLQGNDLIYAGAGSDRVYGDGGNDTIYGESGNDFLYGGLGNDRLYGGADSDSLYGESGNDSLYGQSGNDKIYGGSGDDRLYGGIGSDRLSGDSGNDVLYGDDSETSALGGNDFLYGGSGDDRLIGGYGNDYLKGQNVSSVFSAFEKDTLTGGAGRDTFVVAGLYKDGGINDYAYITDWGHGGIRDRLDVDNPSNIQLVSLDNNTFNVYQLKDRGGLLGGIESELIARIDSTFFSGVDLQASITAGLI